MKVLFALLKREVLEHRSIWKVPAVLLSIGVLVKVSMMAGNLSINIDTPDLLQLDQTIDNTINKVVAKALSMMNGLVTFVMLLVAIFYTLSCLYNERQDESILFWRSLPISDAITVASKLLIALVLVPVVIILCQMILSVVFMGAESINYLSAYLGPSISKIGQMTVWLMLPVISWCLLCSELAKKNPFLLAVVAPTLLIFVDRLFFDTGVSQLITDRFSINNDGSIMLLITGFVFSVGCIVVATVKRSQRI